MTIRPDEAESAFERALALHRQRQFDAAEIQCRQALQLRPQHFSALNLLGVIAMQNGHAELAVEVLTEALRVEPQSASARYNLANAHFMLSRFEAAIAGYDEAISLNPDYVEAHYNRGNTLRRLGSNAAAVASYERAVALKPDLQIAHYNLGNALRELGLNDAAIASYDRAIELRPDFPAAHHNRGNALGDLQRFEAAMASFEAAVSLRPDYPEALNGLGMAAHGLRRYAAAIASYDRAIALRPEYAEAYANRGNALCELKQYAAAIASYDAAMELEPDLQGIRGARLYVKMLICDWSDLAAEARRLGASAERGEPASHPFCFLAVSASEALQRQAASAWVQAQCPFDPSLGEIPRTPRRDRIRIGYFSADFRNHPVARLTAELFELHDRSRFEVIGFSFGPPTHDDMRRRIETGFDRFIDVRDQSDRSVAALARDLGLDIAVDLGGFTEHARPAVFALRVAPLQVSYIGYLGTMAANYMDYLICDSTVIPPASRPHYAEKLIVLPSYQVNDTKRCVADRVFTRQELSLPRDGCVYCCFNASYKISPATFAAWMRILTKARHSVLLLYVDNDTAAANLRREAQQRGVAADRLVFAGRLPYAEYLARYGAADLFLDTLPYNAGATASDALWAGLPVLTCLGDAFAGRVAASLLTAIELPELIARTQTQYEQLAVDLAADPVRLAALRARLAENRSRTRLFDTRRFVDTIEAAYTRIHDRQQANLPPCDIEVRPA